MINISTDSNLLMTSNEEHFLKLYEAKLFFFYDHRYSTFENVDELKRSKGLASRFSVKLKYDHNKFIVPRFYASEDIVDDKNKKWDWEKNWYFAFRVISRSTDERTSIASIIPKSVVSNSAYLIFNENIKEAVIHLANMNSFVYDFAVRAKVNVNFPPVILGQCPFLNGKFVQTGLYKIIAEKVLNLVYTAYDLKAFAHDLNYNGEPFTWDEEERFQLKCELDAIYGHLYGLARGEFDYILETFPIVKRKDMEKYGIYRTKDTILKLFDEMEWVKEEMEKGKNEKPN